MNRTILRLVILLITTILPPPAAFSRTLVIRDFKAEPLDLTATARDTRKVDRINGNTAALIKITTPLQLNDLDFTGTAAGIVATEAHTGQIWLYIPERSQRITIIHKEHGSVNIVYPDEIVAGRTYSMTLNFEGKDVSFQTSAPKAVVTVDGVELGEAPQTVYLAYGVHEVKATKGTFLFDGSVEVSKDGPNVFDLLLEDENLKYADITVTAPGDAEIWFEGQRVGLGKWTSRLRQGQYIVETRKANHDSRTTPFTVEAGNNATIKAVAPEPYRGWLHLFTVPENNVSVMAGDTVFTRNTDSHLPVGTYELTFSRRGYNPATRTYRIARNEEITDTVVLRKKQYVRSTGGFVGAGFTYGTIPGVSIDLGATYHNVMLEASFTLGLGRSKDVSWFQNANDIYEETENYSMNVAEVKLGYQFRFIERIGLTPQAGFMAQMLKSHAVTGVDGNPGSGALGNKQWCGSAVIGVRAAFMPMQHMAVYINPEYAIPMVSNGTYNSIAPIAGISRGGLYAHIGVTVNF